ncbi:MAG: DUF2628 domain-containing protein [Oscillospiraceae bacterium]|nr:DUF2628 domain-containing protein [Oscillospiraceae bacterium]
MQKCEEKVEVKEDRLNEENIKLFIGNNADKIYENLFERKRPRAIAAALLGPYWLCYRKMYILGVGLAIIESLFAIYLITRLNVEFAIGLVANFILMLRLFIFVFVAPYIYKTVIKYKIGKISNEISDEEKFKKVIEEEGGTNSRAVMLLLLVWFLSNRFSTM